MPSMNPEFALRDLEHRDPRVRVQAAEALGSAPPELRSTAAAALRPHLDDEHPDVRYLAALALGELRDAASVAPLIEMLRAEPSPGARQAAAIALGQIGDRDAVAPLLEALEDGPPDLRFQAVGALAQLDPQGAPGPLARALADSDAEVRGSAAAALGDLGERSAAPAIAALLQDASEGTRFEAAVALARLGDPRATEPLAALLEHPERGDLAAEQLFRSPDERALPALQRAAKRWFGPAARKVWAAAALARLGQPEGRELLQRALQGRKVLPRALSLSVLAELPSLEGPGSPLGQWAGAALRTFAASGAARGWEEELSDALARASAEQPAAPQPEQPEAPER